MDLRHKIARRAANIPELRNYTPSTAEWLGNQFGDALEYMGVPKHTAHHYGGKMQTATSLTGVPTIVDGVGNLREGIEKRDWAQGGQGAGEVALGVLPGGAATRTGRKIIGALMQSPMRAAGFGAATTVPGAVVGTREAMAAKGDLEARLRSMSPSELKAYQSTIEQSQPLGRLSGRACAGDDAGCYRAHSGGARTSAQDRFECRPDTGRV